MSRNDAIRRALLGRLPTPPDVVARHRITLAGSDLHRCQGTGLSSVINSTAAIAAAGVANSQNLAAVA